MYKDLVFVSLNGPQQAETIGCTDAKESFGKASGEREGAGPTVFPFAVGEGEMWFHGGGDVAVHRLNSKTMENRTVSCSW